MLKLTVSQFTNPHGERVAQGVSGGMPVTRELDSRALVEAALEAALEAWAIGGGGRYELWEWDGDTGVERLLHKGTVGRGASSREV